MFSDTGRVQPPDTGRSGFGGILDIVISAPVWAATTGLGGVIAGTIGLFRRERSRGLAIAGLVVCGAVLGLLLWDAATPTSGPPN